MPENITDMRIRELQLMAQRYADLGEHQKASQVREWCGGFETAIRGDRTTTVDKLSADALVEQSDRAS
jgi:hypothetical protein